MLNELAIASDYPQVGTLSLRRMLTSCGVSIVVIAALLVFALGGQTSAYATTCSATNYSVTSSSPPNPSNWTNPALWASGSYPGSGTCDTASDTNGLGASTTII